MRAGLYFRLAGGNIRKNGKVYFPYILTCVCMISIFYITAFLARDPGVRAMRGGNSLSATLSFGCAVVGIFSAIFLFYTNSFIVKRRRRELGLYNILGMAKHNIAEVMFVENAIIGAAGLVFGLVFGVLLSKLAQMCLFRLMGHVAGFDFYVSVPLLLTTSAVYAVIFTVIYLGSLKRLGTASPIELLHESSVGERAPKGNLPAALVGLVILGFGYWLALSIKDPLQVTLLFFVAVILVIIGTYICFISGSVMFLQLLRKNRRYYYSKKHFVPVSGMSYRMKRNGAGLASICILATMVLVTISSTCCLYFGMVDSVNARYPRDINVTFGYDASTSLTEEKADALRDKLVAALGDTERKSILDFRQLSMSGGFENGVFDISERFTGSSNISDYGKIANLRIVSLSDYNRISGKGETLAENEVLLHALRTDYGLKTISLGSVETFTVKKTLDAMPLADGSVAEISPTITLVVSDFDKTAERLVDGAGEYVVRLKWIYDFDCSDELEEQDKVCNMIAAASENGGFSDKDGSGGWQYLSYESRAAEYADFAAVYGGLFFLGVTLSLVFSCAAVLIIYYKQLSEGYEDAQRFEIMQKVGMTKPEIRRSINSQLLTVFFLPLLFAGLHLAFAFPFIRKILYMFSFYNTGFLIRTTVISFFVFALLYALVYKKTSNTYYKIVSK